MLMLIGYLNRFHILHIGLKLLFKELNVSFNCAVEYAFETRKDSRLNYICYDVSNIKPQNVKEGSLLRSKDLL